MPDSDQPTEEQNAPSVDDEPAQDVSAVGDAQEPPNSNDGSGGRNDSMPPDGGAGDVEGVRLEDEVQTSYLGYAMSVIIGRALPDIRDGLKPVHRRCLFAMDQINNRHDRPFVKCARISGEVVGKYHPHGDQAVYETIVRMAQDWNMRYPLVQPQGNFGSIDGDPPAASRYTEARMARITQMLMADINMETVDYAPNYDETLDIPLVLPTRIPNLLVNGTYGIAVAMATNIPPHNLGEVVDACLQLVDDPDLTVNELMQWIEGPDLPTAGIINGRAGIVEAYRTGNGRILVRSRAVVETDKSGKESIVVSEIPYHVNKALLIERIADLVKEKKIVGITELRDESDKDGLRIVIEIRRSELGQVVLNNLYKQTSLENSLSINCVALVDGQPRTVNLKDMLVAFLEHRREVVSRRTNFLLRQARSRGHILEGQAVALANIDEVVELIRAAANRAAAHQSLVGRGWQATTIEALLSEADRDLVRPEELETNKGFHRKDDSISDTPQFDYFLSDAQASAILELQLHRLTGLEQDRIQADYEDVIARIRDYLDILSSDERVNGIIKEELKEVRDQFADPRRTEIVSTQSDLTAKELVNPKDVVITVSHLGYAKIQPLDEYRTQRRGGRGIGGAANREDDFIEHLLTTHNHDTLMIFTDLGRVYWLDAYEIPEAGRTARGRPLVNLLRLQPGEKASVILPIKDFPDSSFVFMATQKGRIKRTTLNAFKRRRTAGLQALKLNVGDRLIGVEITDGSQDILLVQSSGRAARFKESDVRVMGRQARGVKGMRLSRDESLIALIVPHEDSYLFTVTENGIGKRVRFGEFPVKSRALKGMIAAKYTEKAGHLVAALQVHAGDEAMLINETGKLIRISLDEVRPLSRQATGVRLMRAGDGEKVLSAVRIEESTDLNGEDDPLDTEALGQSPEADQAVDDENP